MNSAVFLEVLHNVTEWPSNSPDRELLGLGEEKAYDPQSQYKRPNNCLRLSEQPGKNQDGNAFWPTLIVCRPGIAAVIAANGGTTAY